MQTFLFIFLCGCFFAFTGMRIYHLIFAVDSQTGFFLDNHISIYILFVMIIFAVCFYSVLYLLKRKVQLSCYEAFDRKFPLIIISGILAVLFLSEGIVEIIKAFMTVNVSMAVVIKIISSVVTAIFFIMLLFRIYEKKPADSLFSLSSLGFVLWSMSNILTPFIVDTSVNTISEYTFTILYYCSLCAFAMSFAKFVSGRKNIYGVLVTSSISIIFSGILNIAPAFSVLFGGENSRWSFDITTLISYGVFLLLMFVNFYCGKYIRYSTEYVRKSISFSEEKDSE